MANISDIVNIQILIGEGGLNPRDFGITLFMTPDTTLPASDSLRIYENLDGVSADFAEASEPFIAAQLYFAQALTPKPLMIGRWFKADSAAELVGGFPLPSLATLQAITDGSFSINSTDITGLDFSTDTSYTEIAATITSALTAAAIVAACTFDSLTTAFIITTTATGAAATLTYAGTAASGTDISAVLLLTAATATSLSQGQDAESITAGFDRLRAINAIFYFVTLDVSERDQATQLTLSTHIQVLGTSAPYMFMVESANNATLTTDETSSNFAQLFAAQSSRTSGDWETATQVDSTLFTKYMAVSSAAYLSGSFNFEQINGLSNPNLSDRPLIQQSSFTASQTQELNRKQVNRFSPVGGGTVSQTVLNIYQFGQVFKTGLWQDIVYATDWLTNLLQVNIFNLLKETTDLGHKVPQTVDGQNQVKNVIEQTLSQAALNGMVAPGQLSNPVLNDLRTVTGNQNFNGFLTTGFLVFGAPFSTLSEQDRIARKLPIFYFWAKAAGAVNRVDVVGIIDQ